MKEIILVGGGGHCRAVIDIIEQMDSYVIAGIVDKKELVGSEVLGYKVIGCDDDLEKLKDQIPDAIVTVGHIESNELRKKLYSKLKELGFILPSIVSPRAYIAKGASVDEGSVVMHDAIINSGSSVGKNSIINTKALVEHECIVEDNCHISTGAILNGNVVVKEDSFVGSGAVVVQGVRVDGFVKAGSVFK
jgi:sugar O-acyltransferase (sialic acid O-acetyltransferase NeuD family)